MSSGAWQLGYEDALQGREYYNPYSGFHQSHNEYREGYNHGANEREHRLWLGEKI